MRGITEIKQRQIKLSLTAEDWELYTASKNCDQVARNINRCIETHYNNGESYHAVMMAATKLMWQYSDYGAVDSEPLCKLEEVLEDLFGKRRSLGA